MLLGRIKQNFKNYTTPIIFTYSDGIQYWREKILLTILYLLLYFTVLVYIPSVVLSIITELWLVAFIDLISYPIIIYLYFSKKKSVKFRSLFLLSFFFLLASIVILELGAIGAGFYWLFVIAPIAVILADAKTGYIFLILKTILLLCFGLLANFEIIKILGFDPFDFAAWATVFINFVFINTILTIMIAHVLKGLNKILISEQKVISELSKKQTELLLAKEKAENADGLKSQFLAQISHEIRTPINTITTYLSLLEENLKNNIVSENSDLIKILSKAGLRIIRTVDSLINLSEVQIGSYHINKKKLDLYSDVILKIYSDQMKEAKEKNISFDILLETDETIVLSDYYSVYQIFSHLIENAIKFTHNGGVQIIIRKNDLQKTEIEINDTGIGIDQEYLKKLFSPFSQEEEGYTRKYEGNGIGLTLVKSYCNLNNISIEVKSSKDNGSQIKTTFPN